MKTLVVNFQGGHSREYHYCYAGTKEAKPGDYAIVHNGNTFEVVIIRRAIPGVEPRVTKYALGIITQEDFDRYLEQNKHIEKYRSLEEQLEYRLKLKKRRERLKEMAADDPQAMALIRELEIFEGTSQPVIEAEIPSKDGGNA